MPSDAERDPVEWAQHSALVAISVARTVLDLVEAAVADRERLERMATSGRSFAEAWLGDATRLATTVVSGFGLEPEAKPAAPAPAGSNPAPEARPPATPAAPRAGTRTATTRPAKKATTRTRATPAKTAKKTTKKAKKTAKRQKASPPRPNKRRR